MSKNSNQPFEFSQGNQSSINNQPLRVRLDLGIKKLKYAILFLAVATGVAGAIIAIYAYNKVGTTNTLNIPIIAEAERLNSKDIKNLTDKISQIAVLPEDETPIVLPISDLTKFHANPFFQNAKLKDKILIFKKAERIILYDPLGHKIVNMGPYSENPATPLPSPAAQYESPHPSPEEATESGDF